MTALDAAWQEWLASAAWRKWSTDSPHEWHAVQAYRAGGSRPTLLSHFGRALVYETDAWHAGQLGQPPPPPPAPSVFAGVGVFTAQAPELALALPASVSWVAVRPDLCSVATADSLRSRFRLLVWEANTYTGQAAVDRLAAAGYIGQSEGPGQRDALRALGPMRVPVATVGQPDYIIAGWTFLFESYMQDVPAPGYFGVPWFPVLGVWGGFRLDNYLATLGTRRDFSVYLAEGMTDADRALLATL